MVTAGRVVAATPRLPPQNRSATAPVVSKPLAIRRKLSDVPQPVAAAAVPTALAVPPVPLNQKALPPFEIEQGVKHNWRALYN